MSVNHRMGHWEVSMPLSSVDLEPSDDRAEAFIRLAAAAAGCRLCPRMDERTRVLGPANGPVPATVCFVAEAPGRHGGDRTAIPLSGDRSGQNFDLLLAAAGLDRDAVFITNAVLCNPRDAAGRNAPPRASEIRNCSRFLAATLDLVQPRVVVALGATALAALARIAPHGAVLARDVGRPIPWEGQLLVPLYHPGARAQIHRSFDCQREDFRQLADLIRHTEEESLSPGSTACCGAELRQCLL